MLRSELMKKLNAEAEKNTPDVLDKIMTSAGEQGLFYGLGKEYIMNNNNGAGSATAIKGGGKAMVGVSSAVAVLACATVAGFAIWGGFKPSATPLYMSETYAVGAVSAAKLLDESLPESEETLLFAGGANVGGAASGAGMEVFDRYFNALDLFGGNEIAVVNGGAGAKGYNGKTTVKTENYYGADFEYVMYYTETEKEDGSEGERVLSGEITVDGTDYYMRGERSVKDGADLRTTMRVFAETPDSGTYVQVDCGAATGARSTGEREYRYTLVIDGETAESSTVKTGGGATYTLNIDGENGGSYRVVRSANGGAVTVGYTAGNESGQFEVKLKDGGYEYVFGAATDPDGVKSIAIRHVYGNGKYLWNIDDVLEGRYNLYGARLEITQNDGKVINKLLTADMFGGAGLSIGNHEITVEYGGQTAEFTVFVASKSNPIEVAADNYRLDGSLDTVVFDYGNDNSLNFGGLAIEGEFNVELDGNGYYGYYGETPVDERFVRNFDCGKSGMQTCILTSGNMKSTYETICEFNVFGYESATVTRGKVFLSEVLIRNANMEVVCEIEISPEKPYIDVQKIADRNTYFEPDYSTDLIFKRGDFVQYSGGGAGVTKVENIESFNSVFYNVSGNTDLWSFLNSGERIIKLENAGETIEVGYTVYDSDYTNIRFCRVHGETILDYELKDGVTIESIKQDLLTRTLYVEYFEKVNGKYVDFVPVTEDMLNFDNVDVNSYDHQYGRIEFCGKTIAVNIVKPYSVAGAQVLHNLTSTRGVNMILSDATVNDLGQCMGDVCKEIVLYDNGVAMLKHTANGVGNVLTGYKLEGDKLTLLRHGSATTFLTVNMSGGTFEEIDFDGATAGMTYNKYEFGHLYFPDTNSPLGWTATFTAYSGSTGFNNAWYVNVYLTGWASSTNEDGYNYQIAGVEYAATWAYGWHNNKNAFVLRFADRDWWFEIGTADDLGVYELKFIKTTYAS